VVVGGDCTFFFFSLSVLCARSHACLRSSYDQLGSSRNEVGAAVLPLYGCRRRARAVLSESLFVAYVVVVVVVGVVNVVNVVGVAALVAVAFRRVRRSQYMRSQVSLSRG
jgi:hypothetical protein